MENRVFVLDHEKNPLMPCHPARARELLKTKKAAIWRQQPFTIIMKERVGGELQPLEMKIDPGSKVSGMAVVADFPRGKEVLWASNIEHRGHSIKESLEKRRNIRRGRRNRKTRYRPARFMNRTRPSRWLPPSLRSRVENIQCWVRRIKSYAPVSGIQVETVKFDTQKMESPEISGVEYQQGELAGYEVREYLLEKWDRKCAYCGKENVPLEVEHIIPKSNGGSNRVSNLTIACKPCNKKKGNKDIRDFLKNKPEVLKKVLAQSKKPLKDAAAVNTVRYAIGDMLKTFGLPVSFSSGSRTKFNRTRQGYAKDHWIDAACVGISGDMVKLDENMHILTIKAKGRGNRQMVKVDKYGFPRTSPKSVKTVHGFQSGDFVEAKPVTGKNKGRTFCGRLGVRATGSFVVITKEGKITVNYKYCRIIQKIDGYAYSYKTK